MSGKRVLFSWSGGGVPGLDIHVGIWRALEAAGIASTANAGTSAGAVIGALNSTGRSAVEAMDLVRGLRDRDVRAERWFWRLRLAWLTHIMDPGPIKRLLVKHLPPMDSDLEKPLHVFATEHATGEPVEMDGGWLRENVLASMAISGVWPRVRVWRPVPTGNPGSYMECSDGGTTANVPLPADWESYDEVWLLIAKRNVAAYEGRGLLGRLIENLDIMAETHVRRTIWYARSVHKGVRVVRPQVTAPRGMFRFDHALIDQAYDWTRRGLADGRL